MEEQTSWRKPGTVSAADRTPPPIVSCASRTSTLCPVRTSVMAAVKPFGPEPMTIASQDFRCHNGVVLTIRTRSTGVSFLYFLDAQSTSLHRCSSEARPDGHRETALSMLKNG